MHLLTQFFHRTVMCGKRPASPIQCWLFVAQDHSSCHTTLFGGEGGWKAKPGGQKRDHSDEIGVKRVNVSTILSPIVIPVQYQYMFGVLRIIDPVCMISVLSVVIAVYLAKWLGGCHAYLHVLILFLPFPNSLGSPAKESRLNITSVLMWCEDSYLNFWSKISSDMSRNACHWDACSLG